MLLAAITGNPRFDAIGSIAIGLLLVVIALTLAVEMKSLLIGEAASRDDLRRVRAAIEADARVRRVVKLQTSHLGPDELFVGAELEFDPSLSGTEVADGDQRPRGRGPAGGPGRERGVRRAGDADELIGRRSAS